MEPIIYKTKEMKSFYLHVLPQMQFDSNKDYIPINICMYMKDIYENFHNIPVLKYNILFG